MIIQTPFMAIRLKYFKKHNLMPIFLQILGGNLFFFWIIGKVLDKNVLQILPSPYGELFLEYRWILLAVGIPLILLAQILKLKARRTRRNNQRSSLSDNRDIKRKNSYATSQKTHEIHNIKKHYGDDDLNDLAINVDWIPLSSGGSNFKSSSLHKVSNTRLMIKSSMGMKWFAGIFIAMGFFVPGGMAFMDYQNFGLKWSLLFPLLIGLVFVAAGIAMMFFPRPRYLDKRIGWFWVGKKVPQGERALRKITNASPLKKLVALQVIPETISGKNGSYTSWELNAINKDATRYNILDHGDKASLLKDAQIISEFLSIPIWDNS